MLSSKATTCVVAVVLIFGLSSGFGQTKEELFDMFRLESGASAQVEELNHFWLEFGKNRINELKYGKGTGHLGNLLEETLAPLIDLERQYAESIGTKRESQIRAQFEQFETSQLAQKVFDVLGPEYCKQKVIEELSSVLISQLRSEQRVDPGVVNELQHHRLQAVLKLSSKQRRDVDSKAGKISSEYKSKTKKIFDELLLVSEKRWRSLLAELNSSQQAEVKTIIGKPIDWFHYQQDGFTHESLLRSTKKSGARQKALEISNENGIPPDKLRQQLEKLPPSELAELGLDEFESFEWFVVHDEFINELLELVSEQVESFKDLRKRVAKTGIYFPSKDRVAELFAGKKRTNPLLQDILLKDQVGVLNQVELQIRMEPRFDSTVGLLDPRMSEHLKISSEQKRQLERIGKVYETECAKLLKKIPEYKKEFERRLEKALAATLNDEQRSDFEKYTGRKIGQ